MNNDRTSPAERLVLNALRGTHYVYKHHARHGKFTVDFEFPKLKLRIDVDGVTYHKGEPAGVDTPGSREHTLNQDGWLLVHIRTGNGMMRRFFKAIKDRKQSLRAE